MPCKPRMRARCGTLAFFNNFLRLYVVVTLLYHFLVQASNVVWLDRLERPAQLALDWRAGNLYFSRWACLNFALH